MFENTQKKGKGWFEGKSVMNEKGKLVAKDHSEALVRAKYAKDKPLCTIVCEPCGQGSFITKYKKQEPYRIAKPLSTLLMPPFRCR